MRIPLSSFAHFSPKVEALSINHQGQFPAVTLVVQPGTGRRDPRPGGRRDPGIAAADPPAERRSTGAFQGTAQAFRDSLSFPSAAHLVAAAILVVYIVLGVLYESYIHPITILSAPAVGRRWVRCSR